MSLPKQLQLIHSREDELEELQENPTPRRHHPRCVTEGPEHTCPAVEPMVVQHHFQGFVDIPPPHFVLLRQRVRNVKVLTESVGVGPHLVHLQHVILNIHSELEERSVNVIRFFVNHTLYLRKLWRLV